MMDKSYCKRCARCCKALGFCDRVRISIHTRSLVLSSNCRYLTDDNLCSIYENRHQVCVDWECGWECDSFESK